MHCSYSAYLVGEESKEKAEKVKKLQGVFERYAQSENISKEQLKNAFDHLNARNPYKEAEEAIKFVGLGLGLGPANNTSHQFVSSQHLKKIAEYAYNKGY